MAQSMISIYKIIGKTYLQTLRDLSIKHDANSIASHLKGGDPGLPALFRSHHYDPTTIGPIDIILSRFPALLSGNDAPLCRTTSGSVDVLSVSLSPDRLSHLLTNYEHSITNVAETNYLLHIAYSAIAFWSDAILMHHIDTLLIIVSETLAPSLLTRDFVRFANL